MTPLLTVRNRLRKRMHLLFSIMTLLSLALIVSVPLIGILGLAFFGGGYAYLFYRLKQQPVALTVEEEGIRITNPAIFLPWEEITGVGTWRFAGNEMVGFALRDREAVWDELVAGGMQRPILQANAAFGYDLFVNSTATEPSPAQVAAAIQSELERRAAAMGEG